MSNGRTHRIVGVLAGGAVAFAKAKHQTPEHHCLEVLGGALGGYVGARLPDLLDPPISPRHRSLAHGVVPVGLVGKAAWNELDGVQTKLRTEANRRAKLAQSASTPFERLCHKLIQLLCRLGAGALAGLIGGYGSHLALDACTPASLPLLA